MAWSSKFADRTNSNWIVVVLAPKMFSEGIQVAPGMAPPVRFRQTMSGCSLFFKSPIRYLIPLDFRSFALPFHSLLTDEESKAQKGEGMSLRSQFSEVAKVLPTGHLTRLFPACPSQEQMGDKKDA